MKSALRVKAEKLRKSGLSYSEIQQHVRVSKASLSLWLNSVPLSSTHQKRLKDKSIYGRTLGAKKVKLLRIERSKKIIQKARETFESKILTTRERFIIGLMLYWAEGAKQKNHNVSVGVSFSNSDVQMMRVFYS